MLINNFITINLMMLCACIYIIRLLPIWAMNCTAMRVKIQNEDSIHPGSCSDACQYQLMEVSYTFRNKCYLFVCMYLHA